MLLPAVTPAFRWSDEPWGHALRCRPLERVAQHLFTTRQLRLQSADRSPEAWACAAASVGAAVDRVMRVRQVHGNGVRVLARDAIAEQARHHPPEADALVSNAPGVVLAVQTADCVPLLMADPRTGAAGAVHAGWRGTAAGVVRKAVEALSQQFDVRPGDLIVAVGPSIGPCCYEVGEELLEMFRRAGAGERHIDAWFNRDGGTLRLDLWSATRDQLIEAGIPPDHIYSARLCTKTHSNVFDSYRAEGPTSGRIAALVQVSSR